MRPMRVVALVLSCLLIVPALLLLFAGSTLGLGYALGRDDDGYVEVSLERLETSGVAMTAEDLDLTTEPGWPDRLFDALDVDIRIQATSANANKPIFVGIAAERDVDSYLAGVAHDEIDEIDSDLNARYRSREGSLEIAAPADEDFWAASASAPGT